MAEKKKKQKYVTQFAPFKYPHVIEPDYGNEEYPKEGGEYNVTLIVDEDGLKSLKKIIQKTHDNGVAEAEKKFKAKPKNKREKTPFSVNDWYETLYDEDDNPTGDYAVKFKSKYSGTDKKTGKEWTRKLAVMDSLGKPLPKGVEVWGGSIGRVSFSLAPYFIDGSHTAGTTLRLEGVQIKELREAGSQSAESLGFDIVEDGFDASDLSSDDEDDLDDQTEDDDEDDEEDF